MRFDIWWIARFLHVASAVVWVGAQLTLSLLVRPVLVQRFDQARRIEVSTALGARFGRFSSFVLIPVLLASGLALIYHRGVTFGLLGSAGYGTTLATKIVLALVSFGLAIAHGMVAARSSARAIRIIGIVGVVISLAVVALATSLVP
ncbi:MAG TPA: hypothetical protein VK088_10350 [Acidimicrobiia bacterium]|nr:hypothetical protein [Acidimicrobiia bacterium]